MSPLRRLTKLDRCLHFISGSLGRFQELIIPILYPFQTYTVRILQRLRLRQERAKPRESYHIAQVWPVNESEI